MNADAFVWVKETDDRRVLAELYFEILERELHAGPIELKFSDLESAKYFLTNDLYIDADISEKDLHTLGPEPIQGLCNLDLAEEFLEQLHQVASIQAMDLWQSNAAGKQAFKEIDFSDSDIMGRKAPKLNVEALRSAIEASPFDESFYFISQEYDSSELIVDVHLLTSEERYLRKGKGWKLMNLVEWDKQDGTMTWNIRPEVGVEFLNRFDRGGMTLGHGRAFAELESEEFEMITIGNVNSSGCITELGAVHIHSVSSKDVPVSSDEFNEFMFLGGYFLSDGVDWQMVLPDPSRNHVFDYESSVSYIFERARKAIPTGIDCATWISYLNILGLDTFDIDAEAKTVYGDLKSEAQKLIQSLEKDSKQTWSSWYGDS
jgi:hypothetical protein